MAGTASRIILVNDWLINCKQVVNWLTKFCKGVLEYNLYSIGNNNI